MRASISQESIALLFSFQRSETPWLRNLAWSQTRSQPLSWVSYVIPRRGLGKGFDLVYFLFGEVQLRRAHDLLCLARIAGPHDGARHGGMMQCPGDRDFSNQTVVAVGYLSHALDKRQIVREIWFRKIGMQSAPVIFR